MDYDYTNDELRILEEIQKDLILELFETRDKRYCIMKNLKKAFILGEQRQYNKEKLKHGNWRGD